MSSRLLSNSVRARLVHGSVLGCLLAVFATAAEGPPFAWTGKRIVCPVYGAGTPTLLAMIRIQSTQTEYQRRGFLRIGALPMLVAEQVRIEVCDVRAVEGLFAGLPEWLRAPGKGQAVELRDLKIFGQGQPANHWLSAVFQLPTSFDSQQEAEVNVVEFCHAPPQDPISWRRVGGSMQVTTGPREFYYVV